MRKKLQHKSKVQQLDATWYNRGQVQSFSFSSCQLRVTLYIVRHSTTSLCCGGIANSGGADIKRFIIHIPDVSRLCCVHFHAILDSLSPQSWTWQQLRITNTVVRFVNGRCQFRDISNFSLWTAQYRTRNLCFLKACLHRRFLSRQLDAIFVAPKLHQVSNMFETPEISRRQIAVKIAPGLHVRFWSRNFERDKNCIELLRQKSPV